MTTDIKTEQAITAAFGAKNRLRLLNTYFSETAGEVKISTAWQHVYKLLLWIDQTTGLAHCYESDKCQPGKPWYARSLAFHAWLAQANDSTPTKINGEIDWMFQKAAKELAAEVVRRAASLSTNAAKQRQPYESKGFPSPGDDPELVAIVRQALGSHLATEPSPATWIALVERIRQYLSLDNKRKNLLGEGFEDVLGSLIRLCCAGPAAPVVRVRETLNALPGFKNQKSGSKVNKVDLALVRPKMRTIVTAKWSVRADREKQFTSDFNDYIAAESDRKPFEYVFVTNEFDPARLVRACDQLAGNAAMFTHVVHINTDALKATYGNLPERSEDSTMRRVIEHIDRGRLLSLERWLGMLAT